MANSNQAKFHCLKIHCRSETNTLKCKTYDSVDDIKKGAFALYQGRGFHDDNAILTYLKDNKAEELLTFVPDPSKKNSPEDLFIRLVNFGCAMCSNPFGLVNDQQIFQCSNVDCAEQYCNNCVQAIQGPLPKRPFVCMACRKDITPEHNMLLEKHIIWKAMCKTYGIQSLIDIMKDSKDNFSYPIVKNIQLRLIHLNSRLKTLKFLLDFNENQRGEQDPRNSSDQQLINDVHNLCDALETLTERLKETQREMDRRGTVVETCLEKYRKYMKNFDLLCNRSTDDTTVVSDTEKERIRQAFRMDRLNSLSSVQNVKAIDDILEDIEFRQSYLLDFISSMPSSQNEANENALLNDRLNKIEDRLKNITALKRESKCLHESLQSLKDYTDEYDRLLRDEQFLNIPGSKFILLLEMMRIRTEEFEISNNFPETDQLMRTWRNDYGTDGEFKPKVIELFQAIEPDVKHLFANYNWIYSLSYKIGVIGHGSVGKSALIMNLAEVKQFSSMIAFERSTFGYLQFDTRIYKDPNNDRIIPITFVDIEGATDTDKSESAGNYIQLIKKADCDAYIIVFDNFFSEHNRTCQEHIEKELKRKCLLVRSRADKLFNECFRELWGENYEKPRSTEYHTKPVLSHIKEHALKTFDDKRLEKNSVYLMAAVCDDNLKGASFANFNLNALKKKVVEFVMTDIRGERIYNLAIRTAITVINTCFRRGYVVSQTKYKWFAAGASIIPFLNEVPAFLGREKIRQIFGVHDASAVANIIYRTKDSLEQYLMARELTVPEKYLKSGEFKYLTDKTTEQTTATSAVQPDTNVQYKLTYTNKNKQNIDPIKASHWVKDRFETVVGPLITTYPWLTAILLLNDALLLSVRTVSLVGIAANIILSPIFAAWSFYSTGQRMNAELHSICDDLAIILQYFIINRCNDCYRHIQPLPFGSSGEHSSSDSDDD